MIDKLRIVPAEIYLQVKNNTPVNQPVILFDVTGKYNATNGITQNAKYNWDIAADLATAIANNLSVLVLLAADSTGIYKAYTYTNPSGTFTTTDQVVTGLNSFNIGTFFKVGTTGINVYTNGYSFSSITLTQPYPASHFGVSNGTVNGSFIFDPGYTPALVGTSTQISPLNAFWINPGSSPTVGPYNRSSVGVTGVVTNIPPTMGLFTQINMPADTIVYIGIASVKQLYINNQAIVNGPPASVQEWNIIPVTLKKGNNLIQVFSQPNGAVYYNQFGIEIYNNTAAEIAAATSYAGLNLIFSSINYIGQELF